MVKFSGSYMMWAKAIQDQDQVGQSYTAFYVHRRIKRETQKNRDNKKKKITTLQKMSYNNKNLHNQMHVQNFWIKHPNRPNRTSEPTAIGWALDSLMFRCTTSDRRWTMDVSDRTVNLGCFIFQEFLIFESRIEIGLRFDVTKLNPK